MIASAERHAARGIGMGMHRQGCRQGIDGSGLYLGIAVHDYDDVMAFAFIAKQDPVPRPRFATGLELMNMDIETGRAPVGTQVIIAQFVCRLLFKIKKYNICNTKTKYKF